MAKAGREERPNTSAVVVGALERLGFSVSFGMPGMWSLPMYDALRDSRIRHVLVRHEQFAAYAADGYSRASGKPGLCVATAGPGAVNIAAGIAVSFRDHSPVLAVTGQVPTTERGMGWIEDMDLQSIFSPVTKFTAEVSAEDAYDLTATAYRSMLEGCPGPAHLSLPGDIQKAPSRMKDYIPQIGKPEPDPSAVGLALDAISSARSPLILAGWGAVQSGASEGLLDLAEALPAYLATSYMGRGAIPEDNPLALGVAGRRGTGEANQAVSSCDLLIALGCRISNLTVERGRFPARVLQVDVEEANFAAGASLKIKSDVSAFIEAILPKVKSLPKKELSPPSRGPTRGSIAMDFAKAIATLEDSVFTLDIGQHTIWTMNALRVKKPRSVILSGNLSAMGFSIPAALGAKLSVPRRRVIAVTGDGGLQMAAPELSTLKENDLAVAVCVFNNRSLGLIRQLQERVYGRTHGVDYSQPPDYVKLAEAHGIEGIRARTPKEVSEALRKFDEPLLVEIPIPASEGVEMSRPRVMDGK